MNLAISVSTVTDVSTGEADLGPFPENTLTCNNSCIYAKWVLFTSWIFIVIKIASTGSVARITKLLSWEFIYSFFNSFTFFIFTTDMSMSLSCFIFCGMFLETSECNRFRALSL